MPQRFAIILLLLGLPIQSLASLDNHEIPKYFLKSLVGPDEGIYNPLKISLEVDESALQNTQSDKAVKEVADIVAWILSDLVLSQPLKEVSKFGEKIQCDGFLIHEIIKSQGIDADFGLYITLSNKPENEMATIKKCESSNQLLAVSIAINLEKFLKLETVSQIKFLSSVLASAIFENDLIRNQLLSEIEGYLENWTENLESTCVNNCFSCQSATICSICNSNYYLNVNGTQCCPMQLCETCNNGNQCDSCVTGYYFYNDQCFPCRYINCLECNSTACLECQPGYFIYLNVFCFSCSSNCEVCQSSGIGAGSVCTQCYDPDHSEIVNGLCTCLKPNEVYNQNNVCACAPGFYQDSNGDCQACGYGCQTCTSPTQCTICFDSTHMTRNGDGTCSCTSNKVKFNTTTNTCSCPFGQYLNQDTNVCDPCGNGCGTCYDDTDCITCVNSNILLNEGGYCICIDGGVYDNTTDTCVPCPDGKYVDDQGVCSPCLDGCATCSQDDECTTCLPNLHLSNQETCVCDEVYTIFNPSTNSCVSCNSGQPNCIDNCILGCKVCTEYQTCQTCFDSQENINGVCICKDHKKIFNIDEQKCIDIGSAKGLVLVWILALYAVI